MEERRVQVDGWLRKYRHKREDHGEQITAMRKDVRIKK